jgi:D-alanyl-D-alanine carboxypeptidase
MQMNEAKAHLLDEEVPYRMVWQNSNKLLGIEGFKGVKTGITQTAGPCLCILYENSNIKHKLITVVLGC